MTLSRRTRELLAIPLVIGVALPGLCLWGIGSILTILGRSFWMFAHKVCRDANCACSECRDLDPEFVRSHQEQAAPEPPAAA